MNKTEASIILQKNIRGFLARRKYRINHLEDLNFYYTFVVGNDPCITTLENHQEREDKIALIATSGMRALLLACQLGNNKKIPKIILIDNSRQVYKFWYALRKFVEDDKQAATASQFFENLSIFLNENLSLIREIKDNALTSDSLPNLKYLDQNILNYFDNLMKSYGYKMIRALIRQTSLIKQSWEDEDVFFKVKNILNYHGIQKIYMYPSNIFVCTDEIEAKKNILENIKKINPVLSIHTTHCCLFHQRPEGFHIFLNQDPTMVAHTLFSQPACIMPHPKG